MICKDAVGFLWWLALRPQLQPKPLQELMKPPCLSYIALSLPVHSFPANFRHEKCGCAGKKRGGGEAVTLLSFVGFVVLGFFKRNRQIFIAMASKDENILLLIEKSLLFKVGSGWLARDAAGWVSKWGMRKTEMYINFTGLFISTQILCTVTQFYPLSRTGTLVFRFKIRFRNLSCSWISRSSWEGVLILFFSFSPKN